MAKVTFTWGPGNSARKCNAKAAHTDTVRFVLRREALALASRARIKLGAHTYSGDAEITITHGKLDQFVNLDDKRRRGGPAAAAIEFGHVTKNGHFVEGIHALTGSLKK